jgi:hypothetical protein
MEALRNAFIRATEVFLKEDKEGEEAAPVSEPGHNFNQTAFSASACLILPSLPMAPRFAAA